ncbi:cyclic nucleotide-binding-like protein [Catenaria anguillulae PL171]|uniref:Cyclic nucleotide-binding-like protein n=1 Tax=Catenaria anguillulae PL171 TaxID=765915 RepID=A0A1Y2HD70_9FUNG|nr:cyclic nucleotide-binding-like protein [Catenaria anguillulae PL171]
MAIVTIESVAVRYMYSASDIPSLELTFALLRLVRLLHTGDTLIWFRDMRFPYVPRAFSRLLKNLLVAVYVSLFNSCIFWFTSSRLHPQRRFIARYLVDDEGIPTGLLFRFLFNYVDAQKALFFILRDVKVVWEAGYQAVEMLLASVVYGSIFGNLVSIVRSLNVQGHYDKMAKSRNFKKTFLRQYLIANQFPATLQQRILDQEEFDFLHKKGMDLDEIVNSLPSGMRRDILMHLYWSLIEKVPLFAKTDMAFKQALIERITMINVQSGFYVFKQGDTGTDLFLVKKGAVAIMSADETRLAT